MSCLLISLLCTVSALCADSVVENKATSAMLRAPFELIALPYSYNALEPVIGYETMALHHGKHLKGYVDKLNKLVMGTPYEMMTLEEIVVMADSSVFDEVIFDNAGQLLNHNLYFMQFVPATPGEPQGLLLDAIIEQWGSYDKFKNEFVRNALDLFGSGWVWLAADYEGNLYIVQEHNGGNPVTKGLTPLLGVDVWEHAYYLDYNNRRADYLDALWAIVNWRCVEDRYESSGVIENNCDTVLERLTSR